MTEKDALIGVNILLIIELIISYASLFLSSRLGTETLFYIVVSCILIMHTMAICNISIILEEGEKLNE